VKPESERLEAYPLGTITGTCKQNFKSIFPYWGPQLRDLQVVSSHCAIDLSFQIKHEENTVFCFVVLGFLSLWSLFWAGRLLGLFLFYFFSSLSVPLAGSFPSVSSSFPLPSYIFFKHLLFHPYYTIHFVLLISIIPSVFFPLLPLLTNVFLIHKVLSLLLYSSKNTGAVVVVDLKWRLLNSHSGYVYQLWLLL
jgi:hypothetical protein